MTESIVEHLLNERAKLLNFVLTKVDNQDLAEDILQEGLLKALNFCESSTATVTQRIDVRLYR